MGRVRDPVEEEVTWKLSFQSKEPSEMQSKVGQHGFPGAAGEAPFSATLAFDLSPVKS